MRFEYFRNARAGLLPALALFFAGAASAQTNPDEYFLPDNPPFSPYSRIPLLLGNGFTATGGKLTVTLVGNDAGNTGYMYFVNPATGALRYLFSNKDAEETVVDLGTFPQGAPVVFLYVANQSTMNPKKYTGANEAGIYDFNGVPALSGLFVNQKAKPVSPEANDKGDHRWAISGRVDCTRVVFGFEDVWNGDYDYNDIVFTVTGVNLDTETKLPSPVIAGQLAFRDSTVMTLAPGPGSPATAKLFYTVDGTVPAVNAQGIPQGTTKEYLAPVTLAQNTALRAVAWHPSTVLDSCGRLQVFTSSDAVTGNFTRMPRLDAPVFTPPDGTPWIPGLAVAITQAQGGSIRYVVCPQDGPCAEPDSNSTLYAGPISLTHPSRIRARAYQTGSVESPIASARYGLIIAVASAAYFDRNGDGRIDAARIRLGALPDALPASLTLTDPFRSGAGLTLAAGRLAADPADLHVLVADFSDSPFAFGTGFAAGPYGAFPSGPAPYPSAPFTVNDSAGPVLVSAEAIPRTAGGPDGLRVTFSEDMIADASSKGFPYSALHPGGLQFGPTVSVLTGRSPDKRTVEYTLIAGTGPQPGDSLKLLPHPSYVDAKGNLSAMGHHIAIGGRVPISVEGGGFVIGEPIPVPGALSNNVTLVVPSDPAVPRAGECLDCRTGEWKRLDPARPEVFPNGPEIKVRAKGPFAFDLAFFDNFGQLVNHAEGRVSGAMLADAPTDSLGFRVTALKWYPVSAGGHQVGTGVYIAVGSLTTESSTALGPHGESIRVTGGSQSIRLRLGYLR